MFWLKNKKVIFSLHSLKFLTIGLYLNIKCGSKTVLARPLVFALREFDRDACTLIVLLKHFFFENLIMKKIQQTTKKDEGLPSMQS